MNHEEWLAWRRNGIGGSDAPSIMGRGYSTPLQKYEEKVFDKNKKENWAMKGGKRDEPQARRDFEDLIGYRMAPINIENAQHRWYHASLDGMCPHGERVVEIKKTSKEDHLTVLSGKVPEHYIDQCQHIMKALNFDWMYFYSSPCDEAVEGKILEVGRDSSYTDLELFPTEQKFWSMVLNKEAPALTDKDYADMGRSKLWKEASRKWQKTQHVLKALEIEEKDLRNELIALAKDRNAEGFDVRLTKSICKGAIDYTKAIGNYIDSMKMLYPEVDFGPVPLEDFRKDSFVKWSLRSMLESS